MMRVLIVDDELPVRRLLRRWIEADGAVVDEASSAEEAWARMTHHPRPDVALCDVRMSGKDGLWLAEQIQAFHPATAVVMLTGVGEFDVAVTSLRTGVVDYVLKPFTRTRLSEALRRGFFAHVSQREIVATQVELEVRRAREAEARQ